MAGSTLKTKNQDAGDGSLSHALGLDGDLLSSDGKMLVADIREK